MLLVLHTRFLSERLRSADNNLIESSEPTAQRGAFAAYHALHNYCTQGRVCANHEGPGTSLGGHTRTMMLLVLHTRFLSEPSGPADTET